MATPKTLTSSTGKKYKRGAAVGNGANGNVFRVTDLDGQELAAKVVNSRVAGKAAKRFKNEGRFASTYRHPNRIHVLDGNLEDEPHFFVTKLFDGDLRMVMDLDVAQRLRLFQDVVLGLEALHIADVTHRDLKPENILVDLSLNLAVVADLGIAKMGESEQATAVSTVQSDRLANFDYHAPEQKAGRDAIGPPADIWAMGLILNELFTGKIAIGAGYANIASVSPEYGYLDSIVDKCIQQDPTMRYQNGSELRTALFTPEVQSVNRPVEAIAASFTLPAEIDEERRRPIPSGASLRVFAFSEHLVSRGFRVPDEIDTIWAFLQSGSNRKYNTKGPITDDECGRSQLGTYGGWIELNVMDHPAISRGSFDAPRYFPEVLCALSDLAKFFAHFGGLGTMQVALTLNMRAGTELYMGPNRYQMRGPWEAQATIPFETRACWDIEELRTRRSPTPDSFRRHFDEVMGNFGAKPSDKDFAQAVDQWRRSSETVVVIPGVTLGAPT